MLVACIISIRTRDEITLPVARRLFGVARTPAEVAALPVERIDELIGACTFHEPKARQIHEIARAVVDGVTAASCRATATCCCRSAASARSAPTWCSASPASRRAIGVDIHVHRVTNRWGYVDATTPEKTMAALRGEAAAAYWVEINAPAGPVRQARLHGQLPKCSTCPVLDMCRQVGVTSTGSERLLTA